MLTSNVQLGYVLIKDGGQAVQGGLSCPLPRISKRMDNQQFLLHHLLQKYFIPRTRITELNVRCKHLSLTEIMFTSLTTKYYKVIVQ